MNSIIELLRRDRGEALTVENTDKYWDEGVVAYFECAILGSKESYGIL